jgi:hypothetical protein
LRPICGLENPAEKIAAEITAIASSGMVLPGSIVKPRQLERDDKRAVPVAARSLETSGSSMAAICAGAVMSLACSPYLVRVTRICTAARYPRPAGTVTAKRKV